MSKTGVLLINLGTPDNCNPSAVYRYLSAFLNDPRVVDLPAVIRWIVVNLLVVPFRYKKSVHAYQKIWTSAGSPLLINSYALTHALHQQLGDTFQVELGMRYGNPSIKSALANLTRCEKIVVISLFPQYSSAASGSTIEKFLMLIKSQRNMPKFYVQKDFFSYPEFIEAYADTIKNHLQDKKPELIIFSYHGLPERHINKSMCAAQCSRLQPCPELTDLNSSCYRAQCYETSRLIAKRLALDATQYQVSFQSRLGRTPWIKPYTDVIFSELREKNVRNIAIVCPSFVVDCLETLEEINIRAREHWKALGGKVFTFIPSINSHPTWVSGLAYLVKKTESIW
jgi:ferrochelatase